MFSSRRQMASCIEHQKIFFDVRKNFHAPRVGNRRERAFEIDDANLLILKWDLKIGRDFHNNDD